VNEPAPSTLYVVSTPIGNLEDITLRALRVLAGVDLIAAEDTRTTRVLLSRHGITTPCISFFAGNERRRIPDLLARLTSGQSLAVVSDAGTPGVSDPAALLISAAVADNLSVVAIPGASAALAALAVSGMRMDRFHFEGFLPIKKRRRARLHALVDETRTVILYESVHRVLRTLRDLREVLGGNRRIAVCRELTKLHEETVRGTLDEMLAHFDTHTPRGEFVLVLAGKEDEVEMDDARTREDPDVE
jgi:16S rRNA (cytidine1402-2'-O)-methyltransferase